MISHVLICVSVYVHLKTFRIHSTPLHREILEPLVFLSTYDDMNPNWYSFVTSPISETPRYCIQAVWVVVWPLCGTTHAFSHSFHFTSNSLTILCSLLGHVQRRKSLFSFLLCFQGRETTRETARTFFRYNMWQSHLEEKVWHESKAGKKLQTHLKIGPY